jgi:hypothetical protein
MGALSDFSVDGEPVIDDSAPLKKDGDPQYLREADPHRRIHRYDERGQYINTTARLNRDLLNVASGLPVLTCKLVPNGPFREAAGSPAASTATGAAMIAFGKAFRALEEESSRACVLGTQFCAFDWSRVFFSAEDPHAAKQAFARATADSNFAVEYSISDFAGAVYRILPLEVFFDIVGIDYVATTQIDVGFEFSGEADALKKLQTVLERSGYQPDDFNDVLMLMRLRKPVSIDGGTFLQEIRTLFAKSRKSWVHYRGSELLSGEVIRLDQDLPERYRQQSASFLSKLFGRD